QPVAQVVQEASIRPERSSDNRIVALLLPRSRVKPLMSSVTCDSRSISKRPPSRRSLSQERPRIFLTSVYLRWESTSDSFRPVGIREDRVCMVGFYAMGRV